MTSKELKMTANEKIDRWMQAKQKIITEQTSLEYYTQEDANELKLWPTVKAEEIWQKLSKCYEGLNGSSCPWCIKIQDYNLECRKCAYGKRHGNCNHETNSTWDQLINHPTFMFGRHERIFSQEFYANLWNEIEQEANDEKK